MELFSLTNELYSDDIHESIRQLLEAGDAEGCLNFKKSVLDFVNANPSAYWIIPDVKHHLNVFQGISDDEEKDWDDLINRLLTHGRELNHNPRKRYSLFYDSLGEGLKFDEDAEETSSFFELVFNQFVDFAAPEDLGTLSDEEFIVLHNTCVTLFYCTICKMCQEDSSQNELVDLMVSVLEDSFVLEHEAGDFALSIFEGALTALGVDLETYEVEGDLWRGAYQYNFDGIAEYLIDSDVYDDDYIGD
jgi:hypothetical protein